MDTTMKLRCGIHIGDSFYWGATRIIWPLAWIELKENCISLGWTILRSSERFSLKYEDIIEIRKIGCILFESYQIIHRNESIPKFLLISTRDQHIWDIIIKKLCT